MTELVSSVAQLALGLATLVVAAVAYRVSKQASRISAHHGVKDAFNLVTSLALSDRENLAVADAIYEPDRTEEPPELKRRRLFALALINALERTCVGRREGLLDAGYATRTLEALVPSLVRDEDIYALIEDRGHDPGFAEYCRVKKEARE